MKRSYTRKNATGSKISIEKNRCSREQGATKTHDWKPNPGVGAQNRSWEQATDLARLHNSFDANCKSGETMRNFLVASPLDNHSEGRFKQSKQPINDLLLIPEKALKALHPLKIRHDHASGVAEDIGDHKDFVPA